MTPTQSMATKQHIFDRGKAELKERRLRRPRLRALWLHDEEGRVTSGKVFGQDFGDSEHSSRGLILVAPTTLKLKVCDSGRVALCLKYPAVPLRLYAENPLSHPNTCQNFYSADPFIRSSQITLGALNPILKFREKNAKMLQSTPLDTSSA